MSFGVGIGDFIAIGTLVVKAITTLKESEATIERLQRLDRQIGRLERTLIDCREGSSGIDIATLKGGRKIRDVVADMSEALGACEEAIIRYRRAMDTYDTMKDVVDERGEKGMGRIKKKMGSAVKRLTISADLEDALSNLEEELSGNLVPYNLNYQRVKEFLDLQKHNQQLECTRAVHKDVVGVRVHLGELANLGELMRQLLSRDQSSKEPDLAEETAQWYTKLTTCTSMTRLKSKQSPSPENKVDFDTLVRQKMEIVQVRLETVMIPVFVMVVVVLKCFTQAFMKAQALPNEIGFTWDTKSGRITSITILDDLGGELPVPLELCVSIDKLHGVLEVYFRGKNGHSKVLRGEYCLIASDAIAPIYTETDLVKARRPGSSLLMFMKVEASHDPRNPYGAREILLINYHGIRRLSS
ncbi:hypothetical protein BJ508DRAFT_377059 [Ascobolus immersus RN42]|uniref:Ubiquitin-like domain-containing protein n=1 Tax=Ascobolus immersus RN42 TaxID=1160509 RepID=A0A3N4I3H2_ASCIM|nr:hypothetical protein BJ508DRAFT_377059 [Ascobolus immersus RN42]